MATKSSSNYSILVDVEIETSSLKKQLNDASKNLKVNLNTKDASSNIKSLKDSMEDTSLTFQAANEVFSKSIEIISGMVDQVYELDTALTEFKKVSDLSGSSLDSYVDKLSAMGSEVARTASEMVESAT